MLYCMKMFTKITLNLKSFFKGYKIVYSKYGNVQKSAIITDIKPSAKLLHKTHRCKVYAINLLAGLYLNTQFLTF